VSQILSNNLLLYIYIRFWHICRRWNTLWLLQQITFQCHCDKICQIIQKSKPTPTHDTVILEFNQLNSVLPYNIINLCLNTIINTYIIMNCYCCTATTNTTITITNFTLLQLRLRLPKVKIWKLLEQDFYRPNTLSVTKLTSKEWTENISIVNWLTDFQNKNF